jgi:hypothetical protein
MLYPDPENDPLKDRGPNKDLTIKSQTPDPKKNKPDKKRKGFMTGTADQKKKVNFESIASAAKGAQMLIKTLFPADEPIPRR